MACPVSGSVGTACPAGGSVPGGRSGSLSRGPRGCSFSGYCQPGEIHTAFDIPRGVDAEEWLRLRERQSINELLYSNIPTSQNLDAVKTQAELDALNASEQDVLAVALGAPARQVMLRAEEIGPPTGWRDGYLSMEHGFCPPDYDEAAGALARSPGRVWSDLCERMPGCVSRGRVRESVAALPIIQGTAEVIPDRALWAACVGLGLLCSIYRFEEKYDGSEGVTAGRATKSRPDVLMGDELGEELAGIPMSIALPYWQVSRRMGRTLPHLTFVDQSSYNLKIKDATSSYPYLARFDNMELRWPMFGERAEVTFLKGVAETSASFQHGPDAIAACQEHVMNRNIEGLLREMIRLKEILERMPNAFHSISTNPNSGENYVPVQQWVRWAKFSAPLSRRCPASSGLQFPPYLVMDAFLGRKKYSSFLGAEGVHLRAWLPSNLRAFIAAIEYHYRVPEFVESTGDARLIGVMNGIIEAYTGERGFMGAHRYKVFGILEVAAKTGRTETNGLSGAADATRPWEETHRQFSDAMKERLEPHRGELAVEPHQMRGTFEECRYLSRVLRRSAVDEDPARSIARVTLDLRDTGVTFMPGDRLAIMPLNSWEECAKVAAALGLEGHIDTPVDITGTWLRLEKHLESVHRASTPRRLTVMDILRRGKLAPITKDLALKLHDLLQASSRTVLQVLATDEWPVRGSLGDLLQDAIADTPEAIWDRAFNLDSPSWLADLVPLEVPRTYSIASHADDLLPSTVDLAVSRAEFKVSPAFSSRGDTLRAGVASGFLNPPLTVENDGEASPTAGEGGDDEVLVGVSRPMAFQLPLDPMAPCAFIAGGSGVAPFRSFWQARLATSSLSGGKNSLFLGVQSREKFCFEEELRELVRMGFMAVHTAFSRDTRGLRYDAETRDLQEKNTPPRYLDALLVEQGAEICDLVMSRRQGGLGGYLYVCGSVGVFDSVMQGVRRAIYQLRAATVDNVDLIVNKAFAERRFMLDIFMTPRALPCNLPSIPLSQLALHTGHRPGSRMWIGVHGSVYDVTDFCPMHPGGTLILKSNAGVDCSASFDNLAHTNNPEVASLLTKYFVGHLAPKPAYRGLEEPSALYDLWAAYLRTTVETLVAHQFEMYEIMGASLDSSSAHDPAGSNNIWLRESLPNIIAVRTFYAYQSRLLQGGFASLFGAKMQELVLRLSFAVASASARTGGFDGSEDDASARLPDVLGTVTRAKSGQDAAACTKEVGLVGQLVCDADASLRFQERGVFAYAARSVELDIELLEDLRQEACSGMDAFDRIDADMSGAGGNDEDPDADALRVVALCRYLLQTMERMARRLSVFYAQLSQCSVYNPGIERNPARTRWALVRRYIRDGSLFVLAHRAESGDESSYYVSRSNQNRNIDFDRVMAQLRAGLGSDVDDGIPSAPTSGSLEPGRPSQKEHRLTLNDVHQQRGRKLGVTSEVATRENMGAARAINNFMEKNRKTIRRLSKVTLGPEDLQALQQAASQLDLGPGATSNGTGTPSGTPDSYPGTVFSSPRDKVSDTAASRDSSRSSPSRIARPALRKRTGSTSQVHSGSHNSNSNRNNINGGGAHQRSTSRGSLLSNQSGNARIPLAYPILGGSPMPSTRESTNSPDALSTMMIKLNSRSRDSTSSAALRPVSGTSSRSVRSVDSSRLASQRDGTAQQHQRASAMGGWKTGGRTERFSARTAPTF